MSVSERAGVRLETRPLWRLRASASLTRWVLYATAAVGVAATVRFAVAPPRATIARAAPVVASDRAAEGFATLFARRYLTWDAASPAVHADGLAPFVGGALDPNGGMGVPTHGSERVDWVEVVQGRSAGVGEHVYTVAVGGAGQTPTYLSVDVVRDGGGTLRLGRYPALVGPPAIRAASALDDGGVADLTDPSVSTVVDRALRNYLAGSGQNLAADLAPGTVVTTPVTRLVLDQVVQLRVARGGGVLATVLARDDRLGASYTLTYELDVSRGGGGRWLVDAIQTDPRT